MKKFFTILLVIYSIVVTVLLSEDVISHFIVSRQEGTILTGASVFAENVPNCIVDLKTCHFYHDSWMCNNFLAYEYRSEEYITTMSVYEAEYRGFEVCPLCDPAYKAYIRLK